MPIKRSKPDMWAGAWGLAGSFYKAINFAYKNNYPFLLFLEDDSIPSLNKEDFYNIYKKIIRKIKQIEDWDSHYYILGFTRYCKLYCGNTNTFINRLTQGGNNGMHSVLLTRKSILIIINYLKNNKIDKPIDQWFTQLHRDGILKGYAWDGNISKNEMFCGIYEQLNTNCDGRENIIIQNRNNSN